MLYEALETAGAKAQYDEHVKRLLSFRSLPGGAPSSL